MKPCLFSLLLVPVCVYSAAVTADESQNELLMGAEAVPPLAATPEPQRELARLVTEQSRDLASLEAGVGAQLDGRALSHFTRLRREILELQRQVLRGDISPSLLRVKLHSHRRWLFPTSYVGEDAAGREEALRVDTLLRDVFAASRVLPRQTLPADGWLARETLNIPNAPIRRIQIEFAWSGLGTPVERKYVIEKTEHGNYANDAGMTVDTSTIKSLVLALTDLRLTAEARSCFSHTDDNPDHELTVEFEGGDWATVSSSSNCLGNIPWNVKWKGQHYVQYGVDLAEAVHRLLHELDPEMWMRVKVRLPSYFEVRIELLTTSRLTSLTPEKRMETESYLTLLSVDPSIVAFLDHYDLVGVNLHCLLASQNPACARLNGKLTLVSHNLDVTYDFNVEMNARVVTKTSATRRDLDAADRALRKGDKLRRIWEVNPYSQLHVDWLGLRDEAGMSSTRGQARAVFSAVQPGEVTKVALVDLRSTKSATSFLYLPDKEELWVTNYSIRRTPDDRDRNLLIFGKLLALFNREPGAVAAIRELHIRGCSRVIGSFAPHFLEANSGYIEALEQVHPKVTRRENQVSIWGYCVRVEQGTRLVPINTGNER